MNKDALEALILEARKLALDANRLCISLKAANADDDIRFDAGCAFTYLSGVWTALSREQFDG